MRSDNESGRLPLIWLANTTLLAALSAQGVVAVTLARAYMLCSLVAVPRTAGREPCRLLPLTSLNEDDPRNRELARASLRQGRSVQERKAGDRENRSGHGPVKRIVRQHTDCSARKTRETTALALSGVQIGQTGQRAKRWRNRARKAITLQRSACNGYKIALGSADTAGTDRYCSEDSDPSDEGSAPEIMLANKSLQSKSLSEDLLVRYRAWVTHSVRSALRDEKLSGMVPTSAFVDKSLTIAHAAHVRNPARLAFARHAHAP